MWSKREFLRIAEEEYIKIYNNLGLEELNETQNITTLQKNLVIDVDNYILVDEIYEYEHTISYSKEGNEEFSEGFSIKNTISDLNSGTTTDAEGQAMKKLNGWNYSWYFKA